jgi:hypothetical protein
VEFVTLADKAQMPFLGSRVLDWPYVEGLRLDEAMHPLTLLAFGMYGEVLPNQNGAPVRLVVPWKYGFKSAKSIVKIRFTEKEPATAWNKAAPQEYGFYSNVNPLVDHPRWSQATERRIGEDGSVRQEAQDLDVQRLRSAGGSALFGDGPAQVLLSTGRSVAMNRFLLHWAAKPVVFLLATGPTAWLVLAAAADLLGANPAEALIRSLGDWTLRMLCLVLAVTPLRVWTGWSALARFRRMLGLFVFFLCAAAPAGLCLVRHGLRRRRDPAGHCQAALHPGGGAGIPAAGRVGRDLV